MYDCLLKMLWVYCIYIYIYIYHVNKFEVRLLFLYLPLKKTCILHSDKGTYYNDTICGTVHFMCNMVVNVKILCKLQ